MVAELTGQLHHPRSFAFELFGDAAALLAHGPQLDHPFDQPEQHLGGDRLDQEVEGAPAERGLDGFHRRATGEDDDQGRGSYALHLLQHADTVGGGEDQIGEDEVVVPLADALGNLVTVGSGVDLVPDVTQQGLIDLADLRLVVGHQDPGGFAHETSSVENRDTGVSLFRARTVPCPPRWKSFNKLGSGAEDGRTASVTLPGHGVGIRLNRRRSATGSVDSRNGTAPVSSDYPPKQYRPPWHVDARDPAVSRRW